MIVLITGATGRIGRHLIGELLEKGHRVRALTRNIETAKLPKNVELIQGDLVDIDSLREAFQGIYALHLITFDGSNYSDLTNGEEIIQLAERSGIRRVSVLAGWAPTSIEEALENSDLSWSRIEPLEIMYNAWDWEAEIRENNSVSTLASYPSAIVHEADIAAVAACVLTEEGRIGQHYRVTGPEALTPAQRISIIADVLGRPITHIRLTENEERKRLSLFGLTEEEIEFAIQLAVNPPPIAGKVVNTVPLITGRPGRTFAEWAREHVKNW